jgi:hypothetical protein
MSLVEITTSWRRILGFGKVTHLIINDKKTACGHKVEGELREITMSKRCGICIHLEKQFLLYNIRNIEID